MTKYNKAVIELTLAAIIWGASFTLVRWALVDFSASTLIFWRFIIAFSVGEILHFIFNKNLFKNSHQDIKLALPAGLFLGLSLFFQTYGLNFTSVTNSGFITSLYVVLIPIIATLFFKHKIKYYHVLLSFLAFVGMGLLLQLKNLSLEKGELLTLAAAFTAAFQIMFIGRVAKKTKSAFRFNTYQTFWSCITVLPFLIFEVQFKNINFWPNNPSLLSVFSVVSLAIFVSGLAFYLQVRAQKTLSTTTSSMLCLLEAPFAFIFAAFFLSESLSFIQVFGAVTILISSALSVYLDKPASSLDHFDASTDTPKITAPVSAVNHSGK